MLFLAKFVASDQNGIEVGRRRFVLEGVLRLLHEQFQLFNIAFLLYSPSITLLIFMISLATPFQDKNLQIQKIFWHPS